MTRLVNRLGDRLLGMFLPESTAGACVPEHGQQCTPCVPTTWFCSSHHRVYHQTKKIFSCTGVCTNTSCANQVTSIPC